MGESGWRRAKSDTERSVHTLRFKLMELALGLGAPVLAIFFFTPAEASPAREVSTGAVAIAVGLCGGLVAVFVTNLIRAPFRQRDEAREAATISSSSTPLGDTPTLYFHNLAMHRVDPATMREVNRIRLGIPHDIRAAEVSGLFEGIGGPSVERIAIIMAGEQLDALRWLPQQPGLGGGPTIFGFAVKLPDWAITGEYSVHVKAYLKGGVPKISPAFPAKL